MLSPRRPAHLELSIPLADFVGSRPDDLNGREILVFLPYRHRSLYRVGTRSRMGVFRPEPLTSLAGSLAASGTHIARRTSCLPRACRREERAGRGLQKSRRREAQSCRMKATRSCFSCGRQLQLRTMLKNSTVSSSVKQRPSCIYGGLSLMPRSVNVLIGPSPGSPSETVPDADRAFADRGRTEARGSSRICPCRRKHLRLALPLALPCPVQTAR